MGDCKQARRDTPSFMGQLPAPRLITESGSLTSKYLPG
jgi:hypothetical protein